MQALNVALPTIGREFGANAVLLSWMVTAYVLAAAAFSVPFGRIADIVGIKKIIITGTIIYTLSSTVASFSNSSVMLIICRSIQGMSAAPILVNCPALITAVFSAVERGRALGINVTAVYLGFTAGPFLGGILTGYFGWRSIFFMNIPISLLVILLLLWKVKGEWCECKGEKVDYVGWIIYGLALMFFMYGFSLLPKFNGAILILIGIIGLGFFVRFENRVESPMFNVNIFKGNRTFVFSNLAALINYSAVFAAAFLLSLYLQYIKGLTPGQTGLIMIAQPLVQAIFSALAGRLSDKMEPHLVSSMGMALTCLGLLVCVFLSHNTSLWQIITALTLIGAGGAFFAPPNMNALMGSVAPKYYGVASAAMSTVISIGQMLSMGIAMVVTAIVSGGASITPEHYSGFVTSTRIGFTIFTILCFSGIFVSLFRGKLRVS
jgi:EmrB/QacA subfamily drug resistance transporter